ncbi:MAG TPA: type I restriction endonuclease subunit M, partial [Phycisphaerales bacterium]|nr:type I restriction endonuclease subunit M [Phycisphaerales bacterium]
NKGEVTKRHKEIKSDREYADEAKLLEEWLTLSKQEAALRKAIKDAEAALDQLAHDQYPKLSEDEVKTLVVDDKWLATLSAAIHSEMDRISQALTQRIKELAERYETPLPKLTQNVAELEAKVNQHLERMGFTWN